MEYDVAKHLEFIQNVINRMANASFLLKGWTVTLVAVLFALSAKDAKPEFGILALFPGILFWGLDAYYLRQERLFRNLYEAVSNSIGKESMAIPAFSLDTSGQRAIVGGWLKTLFRPAVVFFHGPIVILAVTMTIILEL